MELAILFYYLYLCTCEEAGTVHTRPGVWRKQCLDHASFHDSLGK